MNAHILVVEDDPAIVTGLVDLLEGEGYRVSSTDDGLRAVEIFEAEHPDLVLLDVMIPGQSGYDVCRRIRAKDEQTPVLMLTAKGQEVDKVVGLELGADDYIVKPFGLQELLARIRAALRRSRPPSSPPSDADFRFGSIVVRPKLLEIRRGEATLPITKRELALLREFCGHDGEVLDRSDLLERIWGVRYEGTTRTLDQHIAKLRQKIESDPANPRHIRTVHGVGYRFFSDPDRE